MAVLATAPSDGVIMALRQRVDVYYANGQWVARSWPRKGTYARSAAEIASSEDFAAAAVATGALDPSIMQAYRDMPTYGGGTSWVDAFRAAARGRGWGEVYVS